MPFDPGLKKGEVISNEKLVKIFQCGIRGGMRRSKQTNTLVIISDHTKSIYEDRWIGDIFHYTGMGLVGDQDIGFAQNKTLAYSNINGIDVFLFEVFSPGKYLYQGQVQLHDDPYQEKQLDSEGNLRTVWVFPLKLIDDSPAIVDELIIKEKEEVRQKLSRKLSDQELANRAKFSNKGVGVRKVVSNAYERNQYVAEYAKRRANGICELCENKAPFLDRDGFPFLETHHITWLSRGGEDSIENTVALCPNCHRKMHILNDENDKEKLIKKTKKKL